ncbi:MAG: helix-turn-helix transcriptional regulator [Lachnospiraceae bacterium]|nr:helix-turn-helix transcriptional regulator [Lachnospiraceae bacterium]
MWNEMTNAAILQTLGERLKEYRLRRNLQQAEMARYAGVNISTVSRIEKGQNIMFDSYLRIMRVLDMLDNLDEFIPEPPRSPLLMKKLMGKKKQRIKKTKEDNYE